MKTTVEAIFEDGVFKPVKPPELPEGQRVQVTVESVPRRAPDELLGMAAEVYQGLSAADEVIVKAAEVYADLKRLGALIGDGDVLIGATALVHGLRVVTDNEDHFRRIPGLTVENWLRGWFCAIPTVPQS